MKRYVRTYFHGVESNTCYAVNMPVRSRVVGRYYYVVIQPNVSDRPNTKLTWKHCITGTMNGNDMGRERRGFRPGLSDGRRACYCSSDPQIQSGFRNEWVTNHWLTDWQSAWIGSNWVEKEGNRKKEAFFFFFCCPCKKSFIFSPFFFFFFSCPPS